MRVSDQEQFTRAEKTADRLHSAAIHLLRRLRTEDQASGLSAPRLSALSVIVFAGPISVSELAAAEQVSKPTISNLVKELVQQGLVRRQPDPNDARVVRLAATEQGRNLLLEGKLRRVQRLAREIEKLSEEEQALLQQATEILLQISQSGSRRDPER